MPTRDFWIERVYIAAKKAEKAGFRFETQGRAWDGFVYFLSGKGVFITSSQQPLSAGQQRETEERLPISEGCLLFLRKGQRYGFSFSDECSYVTTAFDIGEDAETLGRPLHSLPSLFAGKQALRETMLDICRAWDEKKAGRNASCRTRIYDLCRHLFSEYMKEQAATAADGDIERAFSFIRAHYRENFSTEEIAKYCSVSQSYLRGKFKRMTGTSITRFREGLRIGEAKNMLESGFFSMQEIALHLGYSDVYHFSKRFAAATGTPPATYKKLFYTKK